MSAYQTEMAAKQAQILASLKENAPNGIADDGTLRPPPAPADEMAEPQP